MCDYCDNIDNVDHVELYDNWDDCGFGGEGVWMRKKDGIASLLILVHPGDPSQSTEFEFEIGNCPMCGREL